MTVIIVIKSMYSNTVVLGVCVDAICIYLFDNPMITIIRVKHFYTPLWGFFFLQSIIFQCIALALHFIENVSSATKYNKKYDE